MAKTSATKIVRVRIEIPSVFIVTGRIAVEKVMRAAYNRSHCLSLSAWKKRMDRQISGGRAAWIEGAPFPGKNEEIWNDICDCRALHRHKRHSLRGRVPGRLYSPTQR